MKATKFEFERRFWIIAAIYIIGFSLAREHSCVRQLRLWFAPTADPSLFARFIFLAGALLVLGAAAVRTWGAAYLKSDVVHDPQQHSEKLVADGPFRFTRNPLYFANLPMAAGSSTRP
jgi:protein-S-isoprenylcysteine O-methyltransferase Ste14